MADEPARPEPGSPAEPAQPTAPARPAEPITPPDPNRRRFFRQFAGDVMSLGRVGHRRGAAAPAGVRPGGAGAARRSRGDRRRRCRAGAARARRRPGPPEERAAGAGFRAPMRWDGDVCRVVDQRRLPDVLVDIEVRGGGDGVAAIRDEAIVGSAGAGPARRRHARAGRGEAADAPPVRAAGHDPRRRERAAERAARVRGHARDRGTGCWRWRTGWGSTRTGETIAAALRAEAEAIIADASAAHGALVTPRDRRARRAPRRRRGRRCAS